MSYFCSLQVTYVQENPNSRSKRQEISDRCYFQNRISYGREDREIVLRCRKAAAFKSPLLSGI